MEKAADSYDYRDPKMKTNEFLYLGNPMPFEVYKNGNHVGKMFSHYYESVTDLALEFEDAYNKKSDCKFAADIIFDTTKFYGSSCKDTIEYGKFGNDKYVDRANRILESVEAKINDTGIDTSAFKIDRSSFGGAPIVPAYLAGNPNNMLVRRKLDMDTNPINVYIDLTVSASVEDFEIENRGVAALALTMLISRIRPVNLYLSTFVCIGGEKLNTSGAICKVETSPLDIARAQWAMCSPEFLRRLGFMVAERHAYERNESSSSYIPWPFNDFNSPEYIIPCLHDHFNTSKMENANYIMIPGFVSDGSSEQFKNDETSVDYIVNEYMKALERNDR